MALSFIDPQVAQAIANQLITGSNQKDSSPQLTSVDQSGLRDQAPEDATFDTSHEIYTNPWVDGAAQRSILDNSGFPTSATLTASLSYSYTTGYSTEHEQTQAVTVGVTQDFDFSFPAVGEGTTLSASGTFSWTQGTSENKTTSISSGEAETVVVPPDKVYEAKILYQQEEVTVPYSWSATIEGSYVLHFDDGQSSLLNIGATFGLVTSPAYDGPLPPLSGVDWSDFQRSGPGPAGGNDLSLALNGTLSIQGASAYRIKNYDITPSTSQGVDAEYDPAVPIGVLRTLDDTGGIFRDTPFDDWVYGGAGNDSINFRGGEDVAHAAGGDDTILAAGVGRSLLDGGDGDDTIHLVSAAPYGTVLGGAGNDRIVVAAPAAMLYGGAGDDSYRVEGAHAGGTVITDAEGHNRLEINAGCGAQVTFERVYKSDNLYILVGGDTYDRGRDVVWVDFFADPDNEVNGLTADEIAEIAALYRPGAQGAGDVPPEPPPPATAPDDAFA